MTVIVRLVWVKLQTKETKQWGTNAPHCFVRYLADIFFNRFGKCD